MMQAGLPPDAAGEKKPGFALRYQLEGFSDDWIIPEVPVPEAVWHDRCLELLKALLSAWVARERRQAFVFRDIAIGVRRERPRVGFNPDVCVVDPAPPNAAELESLKLYDEGNLPPAFAFEAVSRNHPYKDYTTVPEKCAVIGVRELVVFDPLLVGPRAQGGPWLLQIWRRSSEGIFDRVYAGSDAAWSEYLGAYLLPDESSQALRIANDPGGDALWLTVEEEAKKREQEALARVAELEAELRRRGGG
jgi:Uma2 family endonuclease